MSFKGIFNFVLHLTFYWPLSYFWNKIVYSFDFLSILLLQSSVFLFLTAYYCLAFTSVLHFFCHLLSFYCVFSFFLLIIVSSVSFYSSVCAAFLSTKVVFAVIADLLVSLFLHFNLCSIFPTLFSHLGASDGPLK